MYTLHTRLCTFGAHLHAQSVLINKISASELSRKLIESVRRWLGSRVTWLLPSSTGARSFHSSMGAARSTEFRGICSSPARQQRGEINYYTTIFSCLWRSCLLVEKWFFGFSVSVCPLPQARTRRRRLQSCCTTKYWLPLSAKKREEWRKNLHQCKQRPFLKKKEEGRKNKKTSTEGPISVFVGNKHRSEIKKRKDSGLPLGTFLSHCLFGSCGL